MKEIFIARQPIIDANGHVHGYELLFRHSFENNAAPIFCNVEATGRVLINALNHFGTEKLLGNHYGFLNIDHTCFDTAMLHTLPPEQFVLEILENSVVDEAFVANVRRFSERGFRFALDDMDLSDEMMEQFEPVFPYLSYVKIDLFSASRENIVERIGHFKTFENIRLLAEKVETVEEYESFRELGFAYFQGYFYEKPTVFKQAKADPSHEVLLDIVAMIDAGAEIREMESKFLVCPPLIMSLLKYINSVAFGMRESVSSLRHAMLLLGREALKQWILLFFIAKATGSRFSEPILLSALFRAKLMRSIAVKIAPSMEETSFLTGLLSLFNVMMNMPMEEILESVNLDPAILAALTAREGVLGTMLELVIGVENDCYYNIGNNLEQLGLDEDMLNRLSTESYNWSIHFYAEHFADMLR